MEHFLFLQGICVRIVRKISGNCFTPQKNIPWNFQKKKSALPFSRKIINHPMKFRNGWWDFPLAYCGPIERVYLLLESVCPFLDGHQGPYKYQHFRVQLKIDILAFTNDPSDWNASKKRLSTFWTYWNQMELYLLWHEPCLTRIRLELRVQARMDNIAPLDSNRSFWYESSVLFRLAKENCRISPHILPHISFNKHRIYGGNGVTPLR